MDPREQNEVVKHVTRQKDGIALMLVLVILLISSVAIVTMIQVTSSAQDDADGLQRAQDRTQLETVCRSEVATRYAIKDGEMDALIAEGLVLFSRGEPFAEVADELEVRVAELEVLAEERRQSIENCKSEATTVLDAGD